MSHILQVTLHFSVVRVATGHYHHRSNWPLSAASCLPFFFSKLENPSGLFT